MQKKNRYKKHTDPQAADRKILRVMRIIALAVLLAVGGVLLAVCRIQASAKTATAYTETNPQTVSTAAVSTVRGTIAPLSVQLTSDTTDNTEPGETGTGKLYADNGHSTRCMCCWTPYVPSQTGLRCLIWKLWRGTTR